MENDSICPTIEQLERFAVGRTSEDEAQRIETHLASCSRCLARLPSLGQGDDLMQSLRVQLSKPQPEYAVLSRLRERLLSLQSLATTAVFPDTAAGGHAATPTPGGSPAAEEEAHSLLAPVQGPGEIGRLGPYRVLRILGMGGMGVVFEGEDPQLKRRVALKAMRAAMATSSGARQRFLREAVRMGSLSHDHILAIHHVGEERAVLFLVMPLLQGETLEDRLQREGKLPVEEVLRIGRETALGLAAAHEQGIIHRDIKPSNLWLEAPSGRVKILDFGLARLVEGDTVLTGSCAIVGTPSYMAPEQAEGEIDLRADLFSLGCVLYRMVTGEAPFAGKTTAAILRAVATLNPPPPRQINPATPEPLGRLIERLLSKDRANRPSSAGVVVQALEESERSPAVAESPTQQTLDDRRLGESPLSDTEESAVSPTRPQRWLWFSAAGLLLAGAVTMAALTLWPGGPAPTDLAPVPEKLQVLSLDVKHFATVNGRRDPRPRLLGKDSFVTHCDDSVEVEARLSRPAYAFLIAFRPDDKVAVCFPEKDHQAPPRTDRPRFPSVSKDSDYGLEEGAGLQAFAVVASSEPLPSFKEWWSREGCPWQKNTAPPDVVWRSYDGIMVEGLTAALSSPRGVREVQGKAAVSRLTDWLMKRPQVETVAVLGFAVMSK